jgi:hypothetical protein
MVFEAQKMSSVGLEFFPQNITQNRQTEFLICEDCFWTVSLLGGSPYRFEACPQCKKEAISRIPIGPKQKFT